MLRLVAAVCGFILAWAATFLYETEEGELQNRLEALWIKVDDLSKGAMSREAALIQQASTMISEVLDWAFGKRLLSWKAFATSVGLSVSSLFFCLYFFPGTVFEHSATIFCMFAISLLLSLAPGKLRLGTLVLAILMPFALTFVAGWIFMGQPRPSITVGSLTVDPLEMLHDAPAYVSAGTAVGGVACDIFVIILIRWLVGRSSVLRSTWVLIGLVVLDSCLGLALVAPISLIDRVDDMQPGLAQNLANVAIGMGASNLITALACVLLVVLLTLAFLHRVTWPLLSRPIYAAQRHGLVSHPKILWTLAASCFLFALPHSPLALGLAKLVHLIE